MATETVQASGIGSSDDWTLVAGSTKPVAVNAPDDGTTTYIRCSTTANLTQSFTCSPALPSGSTITQVAVSARCRRGDAQDANYVVGYSFTPSGGGSQSGESGTLTALNTYGDTQTYTHSGLSVVWGSGLTFYIRNTQARRVECTLLEITLTYTEPANTGTASITQAAQTLSADSDLKIAGAFSKTQAAQTVAAASILKLGGGMARTQADNTLSAAGTLLPETTVAVSTGDDDGQETAATVVSLTGSATTIGSTATHFGFVLRNVPIPQGAIIEEETVVQVWPIDNTLDSPGLTIRAERNPANFTTTNGDMSGRTKTSAGVNWTATDIGIDAYKSSPSIAEVVQEIVDDPSWEPGDNIAFFLLNNGTGGSLRIRSYNGNAAQAPRAYFKWSIGAQGGLTTTQGDQTLSSAGSLLIQASATATQESDTLAATAILPVVGTLTATQADHSISSTAVAPVAGQLAATQADDALSSAGALPLAAALAITQADDTLTAAGTSVVGGQLTVTQADDALASTGALSLSAAVAVTQEGNALTGAAALAIVATATPAQADDTLSAAGVLSAEGSGQAALAQDDNTLSAAGVLVLTGAATLAQDDNTPVIAGVIALTGAATISAAGDALAAAGALALVGQLTTTQADDTLTADGEGAITGSGALAVTQDDHTLSASGTLALSGLSAAVQSGDTLLSAGTLSLTGALSVTGSGDTLSGAGALAIVGAVGIMQSGDSLTATGGLNLLVYVYVGTVTSPARRGAVSQPADRGTVRALGDLELQE